MRSLRHTASSFSMPAFTASELAAMGERSRQWEQMERERIIAERRARADIPALFLDARLDTCTPAARSWLMSAKESPGIILRGRVGRGKTHTACAMLNEAIKEHGVRFATFGDILRECKATFSGQGTEREIIDRYTGVPLLAIDDFGKENMTEWALPIVFAVIDKRHASRRRTIITTQYENLASRLVVQGNADTAKAIVSRLSQYGVIDFDGPDRRLS